MKIISQQKGSALIIVLWTVLILSFSLLIASERVGTIMRDTGIRSNRLQAEFLADSAFASMAVIVKEAQQTIPQAGQPAPTASTRLDFQRFKGTWKSEPRQLDDGFFWIEIQDEQSRMNWLRTSETAWRNLFEAMGIQREAADGWFDSLKDWQDTDDGHGANGAETSTYQSLPDYKRRAKNAPIEDMGELFWVMGGFDILKHDFIMNSAGTTAPLLPMTTIYGDGKININTAPAAFIAAALNLTIEGGEQVVKERWGVDGIEGTDDDLFLTQIPPGIVANPYQTKTAAGATPTSGTAVTQSITTKAVLFRVRAVGEYGDQRVTREALAQLRGQTLQLIQQPVTVEAATFKKASEL